MRGKIYQEDITVINVYTPNIGALTYKKEILTDKGRNGGFPSGPAVKNPPTSVGNMGYLPGPTRCPGGGHGNPFQFLPGNITWTCRLQSMGSQRAEHN